jgi:hypothetical protein
LKVICLYSLHLKDLKKMLDRIEHNNFLKAGVALLVILFGGQANAEMKAMTDDFLSGVSGQSGLTIDAKIQAEIGEVAYFDDGKGLALQGIRFASAADSAQSADFQFIMDVLENGAMSWNFTSENVARFEVEEIRFIETPGLTPLLGEKSIGGFFLDFNVDGNITVNNVGDLVGGGSIRGGVYDIDLSIQDGRLGYRTNGNELFLDGMSLDVNSMGTILGVTPLGELNIALPNFLAELKVEAIRFSDNPNNHGVTVDVDSLTTLPSYGSLWANLDLNANLLIKSSGGNGAQGLTVNGSTVINRADVAWGDDTDWLNSGAWIGALGITGSLDLVNLTVDVLDDADVGANNNGAGLALAFERLEANLRIQDFVLGETKTNIDTYNLGGVNLVKSLGSFDINLVFADDSVDPALYTNEIYIQAGGNTNAGYQGLRLDTKLNIISDNNESNLVYTDDGTSLMFSGLKARVDGDITVDVTAAGNIAGTEFYDGLRLGFEDVAFGYSIEGYRIAKSTGNTDDLKNEQLQSAQSIPGLGFSPSFDGTVNGHITLSPGGNVGQEGITINSDIVVTDGSMANFIQSDGNGVWLSGLNYDVHLRDMMLDVTSEGLSIYEGESWSKMDVTDFRVGDKDSGASFGRLILESYTVGSESIISAGGAGQVCIGGVGSSSAACESDNGRWEDRGSQGITVATKKFFKNSIESENKRNRITWETGRVGEGTSAPSNDSGMQLVFDNFTTNDGDGLTDTYGFRSDYNIDISSTRVLKKSNGIDSNGVSGNKGDEKVMNADGTYSYVAPADMTAVNIANRPVGIAVRARTHFKELDFERVNLSHPTGGDSTLLYGLKLQNFDVTTDITATPLD